MKLFHNLIIFLLFSSHFLFSQTRNAVYNRFLKADEVVRKSAAKHGDSLLQTVVVETSEEWFFAGHYTYPEERRIRYIDSFYFFDFDKDYSFRKGTLTLNNNRYEGKWVIHGNNYGEYDYGETNRTNINSSDLNYFKSNFFHLLPQTILKLVHHNLASIRYLGEENIEGKVYQLVSFSPSAGNATLLFFDKETSLLEKYEILHYHDLLGDYVQEVIFQDYKKVGKFYFPFKRIEKRFDTVELITKFKSLEFNVNNFADLNLDSTYASIVTKESTELLNKKDSISVTQISDRLYAVDLKFINNRILYTVFDSFIAVMEAPLNSHIGKAIIERIKQDFPDKPIKYLFVSHHHPDYVGGIRPFIREGCTILTTSGNEAYIRKLASAKHSLQPDGLQYFPREVQLEIVEEQNVIKENDYSVQVYSLENKTNHTNEYLVYYFPKEKLLFEGDLCWIPKKGGKSKANDREIGLYNFISEQRIKVENIYQSWPTKDYDVKSVIDFKELEELVKRTNLEQIPN